MGIGYPYSTVNKAKYIAASQNPGQNYGIGFTTPNRNASAIVLSGPKTGSKNKDPYNWKGIAAELAAQNSRNKNKKSAQKRISAASSVNAAPAEEAPPPAPNYLVKAELDAYRAANGGALPPGITPEMAALVDQGIDLAGLQTTNPVAFNSLLAIQQQIGTLPSAYDASRAKITADYQNLTGDVLTAGQNYMKNLYGNVYDPNDPNAQAFAADPAFAEYANTLGRIEETGDINEATDLAWFTKNQQAQQSYLQNLAQGVASGTVPVGEAIGGGGGGGGGYGGGGYGGRGYGRGGGSGGDGEWSDPKTTSTRTDQLVDKAQEIWAGYNPDLFPGLMAAARTPEEEILFTDIYNKYGEQPIPIQKGLYEERTAAQEKIEELTAQQLANQTYIQGIDARPLQAIAQRRRNLGMQIDPEAAKKGRERYIIPEEARGMVQTEDQIRQNVQGERMERSQQQEAALMILQALGQAGIGGNKLTEYVKAQAPRTFQNRRIIQQQYDREQYLRDKRQWEAEHPADEPFQIGDYPGYVPRVDRTDAEEANTYADSIFYLSEVMKELDPNITPQKTRIGGSTTGTQTDKLSTTQKTYDPNAALGGNLQEIYPNGVGLPGSPFMGGMASPSYNFDTNPQPQYDEETGGYYDPITGEQVEYIGGAGMSPAFAVEAGTKDKVKDLEARALAQQAVRRMERAREEGRIGGWGQSIGRQIQTKLNPPKPKTLDITAVPGVGSIIAGTKPKKTITPPKKEAPKKPAAPKPPEHRNIFDIVPKDYKPPKYTAPKYTAPKKPKKPKATTPKKPKTLPRTPVFRY